MLIDYSIILTIVNERLFKASSSNNNLLELQDLINNIRVLLTGVV